MGVLSWVPTAAHAAGLRVLHGLWPAGQQVAAAWLSWVIASELAGHHMPVFAPITALIALNADRGGRGSNAIQFVVGVILGVVIAGWSMDLLGHGYRALAAGVFFSLIAALLIGGERIVMAQAGVGAIIAVAAGPQAGADRVVDALLGAGVALVFSQILFPAHPLALLRRVETVILHELAGALSWTARDMASGASDPLTWEQEPLRAVYGRLSDLSQAQDRAMVTGWRAPIWWGQHRAITAERTYARQLVLLGNSCLGVTRTEYGIAPETRQALAPSVAELAAVLRTLSGGLAYRAIRQRTADRVTALSFRIAELDNEWPSLRLLLFDLLVFTGVDSADADEVLRQQRRSVRVPAPPVLRNPLTKNSS